MFYRALFDLQDGGIGQVPGGRVFDPQISDDTVLMSNDAKTIQPALDRLAIEVSKCSMRFAN